jgi:hypothetical protein
MSWPGGLGTPLRLDGRCRDLLTPASSARPPLVLAESTISAAIGLDRTIEDLAAEPTVAGLDGLVGARAGDNLRTAIDDVLPDERPAGTPLHLLLDDVAGASLIAGFAWMRWRNEIPGLLEQMQRGQRIPVRSMQGICSGFRPGSSALLPDGTMSGIPHNVVPVPPLAAGDDPMGWHRLAPPPPVAMRRARRIDVWLDGDGELVIDAMFRDSTWEPDGTEIGVHEYELHATADPAGGRLTSVEAVPRVLPFAECPVAAPNVAWLVGAPLRGLRTEVLARLRTTDCCTHLNDALRALAEVPVLAGSLDSLEER